MDLLSYQRTVFAFHGCDQRVADAVLSGKEKLAASENTYDWLGHGIYFWEHGPARAFDWAQQQSRRKRSKIRKPAILGAVISLGNCFDLLAWGNRMKIVVMELRSSVRSICREAAHRTNLSF